MSRPSGWYWVKLVKESKWTVAYFQSGLHYPWQLCFSEDRYKDGYFESVGGIINPPESFSGNS